MVSYELRTQRNTFYFIVLPLSLFVSLSLQLPTVALMILQVTGAWSTEPNSVQVADFSSIVTVVTAW